MSMIGRVFSNFRDFYNEINAATLTGAIDVIVVEQPDGTFTCSPFHVRFGKLGVLRSREKVVDIEINGQPQDIHMKLGDSGEAFFVEETTDNEDIPDPWATSPIPVSDFEELYTAATSEIPRRKSVDLNFETTVENQVNDYSQRRYTGGNEFDYSTQKREFVSRQVELGNIRTIEHSVEDISVLSKTDDNSVTNKTSNDEDEHIFHMDSFEEQVALPDLASPVQQQQPKIFTPETVNADSQPILINNFTPIKSCVDDVDDSDLISVSNTESNTDTKNGKKRRRKKSVMKKKNSQRKSSSSNIEAKIIAESSGENLDVKMSESMTDKSGLGTDDSEDLSPTEADASPRNLNRDPDFHFFSDTELTSANSMNLSRANTPVQSDTEFEFSQRKPEPEDAGQSWAWGQLPRTVQAEGSKEEKQDQNAERNSMLSGMFSFMKQNKRMRHGGKDATDGLYLADLNSLDPEVTALYFPRKSEKNTEADNDCESGNGPSLPQSPGSVDGAKSIDSDFDDSKDIHKYLQDISLSLCGWQQTPNPDRFVRHLVAFSDLCNNPGILESNDLVIRVNSKYYNWKTAMPIVMSLLIYRRPLPQSTVEQLCSMHMPELSMPDKMTKNESKTYSWWNWRRSKSSVDTASIQPTDGNHTKLDSSLEIEELTEITEVTTAIDVTNIEHNISQNISTHIEDQRMELPKANNKSHDESGSQSSEDDHTGRDIPNKPKRSDSEEKYRKTLRLSSEQIFSLNLNEGMNEVEFSVTTAYQGTTRCKCHIYRWRYDDKIVISDIDGTITKSDVLGHLLPIVGKDWAQSGVAQLFTKIKNNGYKLLYLSARAIGQARVTREYLKSIKQGDLSLPDGPLLLNPTSLMSAFHREVIEKKPEQFKIQCLSDIRALFSSDSNPFYAGYGNRINDAWAYRAVGIPIVRIFTINHKGELKHEFSQTFQSSYSNMSYIVDQLFPPLLEDANDFSQFVYWREPLSTIDEPLPEVN